MCCSFFGGLTTMAIALACGFLGGYAPVFLAAILFASFVALFSFKAIDRIGSYEWVDGRGERAASDAAASDSDPAGAR